MTPFDRTFQHVLSWEGGYTDDPDDSGGRTKWGVSEAHHPEAWEGGPPTKQDARRIFREEYWEHRRIRADKIHDPRIALYLADSAYNHGPVNAAKLLQRAVRRSGGQCSVDGWIGPNTRQELRSVDADAVWDRFVLFRVEFYRAITEQDPSQAKFLRGWLNRALDPLDI